MIHETAVLDETRGRIVLGDDVEIMANAVLVGPVEIGSGTRIFPHAVIGYDADHLMLDTDWHRPVEIGSGVTIRESTSIQRGVVGGCGTQIEDCAYIMHGCYVAHDCVVEGFVKLASGVSLGGHSRVMVGSYLGMHSAVHQWVTVGSYCMLGMGAMLVENLRPGVTAVGVPAKWIGENTLGLERGGVDPASLFIEVQRYERILARV